jgi:membrane associated rhomboid family serine protease
MFPLRDSIPSERRPVINILIIVACVIAFVHELSLGPYLERYLRAAAFVPTRMFHPAAVGGGIVLSFTSIVRSMFLHGGWMHLIGNMWFLWIFGDNVEDALGHVSYVLFYLVCGVAAALTQAFADPTSSVPMIGASGAIAGVLGAYLVWYPWARVRTAIFLGFFFTFADIPAPFYLLYWFAIQFVSGTLSLAAAGQGAGGVAFLAHVGGFITGAAIAIVLRVSGIVRPRARLRSF